MRKHPLLSVVGLVVLIGLVGLAWWHRPHRRVQTLPSALFDTNGHRIRNLFDGAPVIDRRRFSSTAHVSPTASCRPGAVTFFDSLLGVKSASAQSGCSAVCTGAYKEQVTYPCESENPVYCRGEYTRVDALGPQGNGWLSFGPPTCNQIPPYTGSCALRFCEEKTCDQCGGQGQCTSPANCPENTGCVQGCCTGSSPTVVDVEGDGFELTSAVGGVIFDILATGAPYRVSWTSARSDDGWLALDRNRNGRIDDGTELFGNITPQPAGPRRELNGFRALAVFDGRDQGGDGDGWITSADSVFPSLLLWTDRNHNGVSEPGELTAASAVGIEGISVDYKESKVIDQYGNQFRFRSKIKRDGGRGVAKWAYDVFLMRSGT